MRSLSPSTWRNSFEEETSWPQQSESRAVVSRCREFAVTGREFAEDAGETSFRYGKPSHQLGETAYRSVSQLPSTS